VPVPDDESCLQEEVDNLVTSPQSNNSPEDLTPPTHQR